MLKLRPSWPWLLRHVDTRCGLLAELVAERCITEPQRLDIAARTATVDRNMALLLAIRRRSAAELKTFAECLARTKQFGCAALLVGKYTCSESVRSTVRVRSKRRLSSMNEKHSYRSGKR